MPHNLKVLDGSARTHDVVLLERRGRKLLLQSPTPINPGTLTQLKLEGELLFGEVVVSTPRSSHFEIGMEARETLPDSWHPHPDWETLDSEESVMGSLLAMNARLMFHENQRRANSEGSRVDLKESS